jgi:hypothetical protein
LAAGTGWGRKTDEGADVVGDLVEDGVAVFDHAF